jgi:hypothetical protein
LTPRSDRLCLNTVISEIDTDKLKIDHFDQFN